MNDKSILYLIISGVLILIILINGFRYNRLSKELNELKIQSTHQVDSLTYINRELEKQVNGYKQDVIHLEDAIDSLQKVKNKVIIQKDNVIVSNSVSESVEQLKENLEK